MSTLLVTEGLTRRFGGLTAVSDFDLSVEPNEIHALIGPNGAGKSTAINLITGVYKPTAGSIKFVDRSIVGEAPSRITRMGIARTFQTIRIWKQMTLLENVMVGFQCRTRSGLLDILLNTNRCRTDEHETAQKARESLSLVGLDNLADELAGVLSYGQQRLLELARALATQPTLLLLDEPAAGMNPQEANFLVTTLFKIKAHGVSILIIEHNMKLIMKAADRITVLSFGKKIAEGTPQEIRANKQVIAAYLGGGNEHAAS